MHIKVKNSVEKFQFKKKMFREIFISIFTFSFAFSDAFKLQRNFVKLLRDDLRDSRIINGSAAYDGQFPFALDVYDSSGYGCTGALINESWAVTAKHCLPPGNYSLYIYHGSAKLNSPNRKRVLVDFYVTWHWHVEIDFALLHLETPIVFNAYSNYIRLPKLSDKNKSFEGTIATQAGHGGEKDLQYHQIRIKPLNYYHNFTIVGDSYLRKFLNNF